MPITLNPAAGVARDPDRIALLSDIHIAADPAQVWQDFHMAGHFREAARQILAGPGLPDRVLVNGDCVFLHGKPEDYEQLLIELEPLIDGGLPIHLGLGNHDCRDHIVQTIEIERIGHGVHLHAVEGRHVLVVSTRRADFVMLDSLDVTNDVPGRLGSSQLDWLRTTLDARTASDKPVIVMLHHNPALLLERHGIPGLDEGETTALLDLLVSRRQVKALLFGHTHRWERMEIDGLHLVNLPAVAYIFKPDQTMGWIDCRLNNEGARLTFQSILPDHPLHGDIFDLRWRM